MMRVRILPEKIPDDMKFYFRGSGGLLGHLDGGVCILDNCEIVRLEEGDYVETDEPVSPENAAWLDFVFNTTHWI